ncbi:delta-class carbonic anhydrase [Mangrovicoccus sp. HB161399]|uniref:delta-class carbonic anhydrase n=1 Tax=Mangrovicoccus sp. HB161399 TaxID=2720392 RepID=UPI00155492A2|nr:delta-class carbonic anhydrase [Mangrovicoccus sp. HB161399]
MRRRKIAAAALLAAAPLAAGGAELCQGFGPQSPRDISQKAGANQRVFNLAPQPWAMNLCNIHTHTYAEHKGPGFSLPAPPPEMADAAQGAVEMAASSHGSDGHGAAPAAAAAHAEPKAGWMCNEAAMLSTAERSDPWAGVGPFGNVAPGDTVEVHWVFTSCDVAPGKSLGACVSDACVNPQLRVEAQVFMLVNDPEATSFSAFAYAGTQRGGFHQPNALPAGTGEPVVYHGSTTGPSYTGAACSPYQVTWSVRPACMKLNLLSLHAWAAGGNAFEEDHSHGVRELVTSEELLAPIP